jgi:hypothetical protein
MTDKTTKILLATIAAGLWANVIAPAVHAQNYGPADPLTTIARDVHALANGNCTNGKIC